MKYLIMLLLLITATGFAAWEGLGPFGGNLRPILVSYSDHNIVYSASYTYPSQVVKSTDGGAAWTSVSSISSYLYCGAIDPTNHNKLYFGGSSYFFSSTNGGVNWTSYYAANCIPYGLAVNNATPSTVYGVGYAYDGVRYRMSFFKSTDSGVSWNTTFFGDSTGYGYCIGMDRTNPSTVYIGGYSYYSSTYYPLLYKTTDGGANWTPCNSGIPSTAYYFNSIAVHPTNPNIVYAGAWSAIYRSTNAGTSWTSVSTHYYNYALATSVADPNAAYVGGYSDIYKTTNSGASWFSASNGFQGTNVYGLAMSQTNGQIAYYANNLGAFKTTNSGSNWFNTSGNMCMAVIGTFSPAPSAPATSYISNEGIGLHKTTDCGANWTSITMPLGCGVVCQFGVQDNNPDVVYALEGSG
jgi:photosystem II stability/assembly factor-like uncharacterized protein